MNLLINLNSINGIYVAIAVVLVFVSSCYGFCDAAYSSANRLRLEREAAKGDKKAKEALKLVEGYDFSIATILFGTDLVHTLGSSLMAVGGTYLLSQSMNNELAELISSIIFIVLVLLFGEVIPKGLARSNPVKASKIFVTFMKINKIIFFPFVYPINYLIGKILKPLNEKQSEEENIASDEELEAMVNEIAETGIIDEDQQELLQNSIEFKDTSCYEIMTPRVKIFAYDLEDSFESFIKKKDVFFHSRIPVCKGDLDHIVGYLQVKTLLRALVSGVKFKLEDMIQPIVSIPKTMEIPHVLSIMKKNKSHIALIRDEFGGTEGIITLEDILEELVGEMYDEEDKISDDISKMDKRNLFNVNAEMSVDDFFDFFNLNDEAIDEDYATVSGWITDKLDRFPEVGDHFTYEKIDLYVTKVENYHVISATVKYHPRRKIKKN